MKAKRIDSARVKELFAAHVEKISLGIFGLVFLWLCYSAYQTRGFDKTPQNLADKAQNTRNAVERQDWNAAEWQIQIPNPPYVKQVEGKMQKVDPLPFAWAGLMNQPIRENKVRREEPKFLAVRELHTGYGFGAVKPKKDAPLGRQWVVITGLLPMAEQEAEYQKLFSNAWLTDPDLDTPQWIDFQVERAEVDSPAGGGEQWTAINVHEAIAKEFGEFATERPEVVDKKFQYRPINDPVPPLIGREPDPTMAHEPEIPFVIQVKDKETQQKQPEAAPNADENPLAVGNDTQRHAVVANNQGRQTQVEVAPVRLFRFFDYTVENDRMYRYRVKVTLKNPNKNVAKRYLAKPELAEGARRETPWSDPSTVVIVPPSSRVLAGDITPPAGFNEAFAKVLVIKWEEPKAVEVPHEFTKLTRGQFMNYPDITAQIPTPGAPDKTFEGPITFETNTMLVDIIGGERVSGPNSKMIKAPSVMLFMDPFGELVIHEHVADYVEFTARRPAVVKKETAKDKDDTGSPDIRGGRRRSSILDLGNPPGGR